MTRWAESSGAAREHGEPLLGAVGTPDSSEPAARKGESGRENVNSRCRPAKRMEEDDAHLGALVPRALGFKLIFVRPKPAHGRVNGLLKPRFLGRDQLDQGRPSPSLARDDGPDGRDKFP